MRVIALEALAPDAGLLAPRGAVAAGSPCPAPCTSPDEPTAILRMFSMVLGWTDAGRSRTTITSK